MGCPSKKVVKSEHGVALRKNPDLAYSLVEAVAKATSLPVSVKTRLGWDNADDLVEFGKGVQNAGADMICIHARTYAEPYNVPAQWEHVYELKDNLNIPVLGNGGVESYQQGLDLLNNLDGFLVGQASIGNPWVFSPNIVNFESKIDLILKHAQWLVDLKGLEIGMREIRKFLVAYVKSIPGAKSYRSKLVRVQSVDEIHHILNDIVLLPV